MNSKEEFSRQKEISEWVDSRFRGEYNNDRKTNIALGCFDLTLEHHAAICKLYEAEFYGSMYALFRILFESAMRGLYFLICATEEDIDKFEKDKEPWGTFENMIRIIEQKIDLENGPFLELKKLSYPIMNSFTHTGYQHLTRRQINPQTGLINYPDEEMARLLKCSGALLLQTAAYLASMRENNAALIEEVMVKIEAYKS